MKRSRWKKGILGMLIAAVLFAAAAWFLVAFYVPEEQAEVQGNVRYSEQEIRRIVMSGFWEHNSLFLRFFRSASEYPEEPNLRSVEVEYLARDRVRLHVSEAYPVGYLLQDGYRYYFDADGRVTERSKEDLPRTAGAEAAAPAAAEDADVPSEDTAFRPALTEVFPVTGLTDQGAEVGQMLTVEDPEIFREIAALVRLTSRLGLQPDEIMIGDGHTFSLRFGEVIAALGTDTLLEEKLSRTAAILPQLEGMRGTLHLEHFSADTINIIFSREDA